jgi:hypothetical protein
MKIKTFTLLVAAVAILLTGCWQKSVHSYCNDNDIYFDAQILGDWREPDKDPADATTWSFTRGEAENVYRIHIEDKESKADLDGRLFKLGDERFMDMMSRTRSVNEIPAHHLFRIIEIGPDLKLAIQSREFVQNWIKANPNDLAHVRSYDPEKPGERENDEYILTADTARLQKFVREHWKDEGFFESTTSLKKLERKN